MTGTPGKSKPPRQYPAFWEKGVPIFLAVLGLAVLILLIIILIVVTGQAGTF